MYKFAIIGCGEVAKLHAAQIQKRGTLQAVCDINPERADEFAQLYHSKAWYDADELLANENDIDVVVVCTPNGYHAEHCIKSLQANKHVLCESPLCITKAAAWQMIETEKFCRRKLFVVNAVTGNAQLAALKKTIDHHTVDHFFSFDLKCTADMALDHEKEWKFMMFPGGGALYTHFINYLDALVYLFGEIDEAKGFCDNLSHKDLVEVEDFGEVALKMKTEIPGNINWSLNDGDEDEAVLQILTLQDPMSIGEFEKIVTPGNETYERIYDWFLSGLQNSASNLHQSTRTVETIEKIYRGVLSNAHAH